MSGRYFAKVAASLTEEERLWLTKTRNRKLAGGRKLTNAEIGAKIGKPGHWVSGVCRALGSKTRMPQRKAAAKFTEQDAALFVQMWADGVTCAEIGKHWGFREDWASKRAQRLKLPPRNKIITNRMVDEIRRRLLAGESRPDIAVSLGVTRWTVRRYSHDLASPPRKPGGVPRKVDAGLADRMARRGMLHKEIAVHFGVKRCAVSKAIQRYRERLDELSAKKPKFLIPAARPDMSFLKKAA